MANTKKFTVTIAAAQVPSDQTNVPVYLDLSVLGAGHGFWSAVRSDGGDIRVYNAGGTQLAREIVSVDTVGETGEVHFLADSLLSASNNVFTIEYGDGALTDYLPTDTFGRNAVWADYVAVWHLDSLNDSTGNGYGLTAQGGITVGGGTGKVGGATNFDGNDDHLEIGTIPTGDAMQLSGTAFTVQAWSNFTAGDSFQRIIDKSTGGFAANGWALTVEASGYDFYANGVSGGVFLNVAPPTAGVWEKIDVVHSGSGTYQCLVDNVSSYSGTGDPTPPDAQSDMAIGSWNHSVGRELAGLADDIRVIASALSTNRLSIEYANQNDPATFYTLSAEENVGGGDQTLTVTESGAGTDTLGVAVALSVQDTGDGAGGLVVNVDVLVNDSGLTSEQISLIVEAIVDVNDIASGLDAVQVDVSLISLNDTAQGSDSLALIKDLIVAISDAASAADDIGLSVNVVVPDTSTGTESTAISVDLNVGDIAQGSDALNIMTGVLISLMDSGSASEALQSSTYLQVNETAGATGSLNAQVSLTVAESAQGVEQFIVSVDLAVSDQATTQEAISLLSAAVINISESGQAQDNLIINARIEIPEQGYAQTSVSLQNILDIVDTGSGVDVISAFDANTFIADIVFSFNQRSCAFTLKQRSCAFTLKQRSYEYSLKGQNL